TISAPSASSTSAGPVTYTITYAGADTVTLAPGDVTLNATGTATGTVSVSGTGTAARTVTISSITGEGTLGISLAANTASDLAGNQAAAAGPSATFAVTGGLHITSVNGGSNPTAGSGFSVAVQYQDGNGNPVNVAADTVISLSLK